MGVVEGATAAVPTGLVLPQTVMASGWFAVLSAFVAINTVMYGALALAKILPKIYPTTWFTSRNRRTQNRSIYPDPPEGTD